MDPDSSAQSFKVSLSPGKSGYHVGGCEATYERAYVCHAGMESGLCVYLNAGTEFIDAFVLFKNDPKAHTCLDNRSQDHANSRELMFL